MKNALHRFFSKFQIVVKDMALQIQGTELRWIAASLAYSTLLAIIPFLALTLAFFQIIGGLDSLYPKVQSLILLHLQSATGAEASQFISRILLKNHSTALGLTGIVALLFTSIGLLLDMELAINKIWHLEPTRTFIKRLLRQFSIFLVLPFFLALYASFRSIAFFESWFQSPFAPYLDFVLVLVPLSVVYKYMPTTRVLWRPAICGALFAVVGIELIKHSFAWMAMKVFNYNKMYGGFASLPLFFVWVLLMWYTVLGGAALSASLQKRHLMH